MAVQGATAAVTIPANFDADPTPDKLKDASPQEILQHLAQLKNLDAPAPKMLLDALGSRAKGDLQTAEAALVKDPAGFLDLKNGQFDAGRVNDLANRLSALSGTKLPEGWTADAKAKAAPASPAPIADPGQQKDIDRVKAANVQAKADATKPELTDDQKKVLKETKHLLSSTSSNDGVSADEIKDLQAKLGMPADKQTGKYDAETIKTVRQFQKDNKLHVDGDTGQETWSKLLFKDSKPPKWGKDLLSQTPAAGDPPPAAKGDPPPAAKGDPPPAAKGDPPPAAKGDPPPAAKGDPPPAAKGDPPPAAKGDPPPAAKGDPPPAAKGDPPPVAAKTDPPPAAKLDRATVMKLAGDLGKVPLSLTPANAKAFSENAGKVLAALNDGTINTGDLMDVNLSRQKVENIQDSANLLVDRGVIDQQKKALNLDQNLGALNKGWLAPADAQAFQAAVKKALADPNSKLAWGPPGMAGRGIGITEAEMDKLVKSAPDDFAKNELKLINKDLDSGNRDDANKQLTRLRSTTGIDLQKIAPQLQEIDNKVTMNGLHDRIAQLGEGKLTYAQAKTLETDISNAQKQPGQFQWGSGAIWDSGWKYLGTTEDQFQSQITQQGLKELAGNRMSKADAQQFAAAAKYALSQNPNAFYDIKVNGHAITADDIQGLVDKAPDKAPA